jgi:succinate dehydrogenase/fumarate reductase flavoprotein subunit
VSETLRPPPPDWDAEADIVVIGSGAGGMATAIVAASLGGKVLVAEKAPVFGGGCAVSGGVVWVPANKAMLAQGVDDSAEQAMVYLRSLLGNRPRWEMIERYVAEAPAMVEFMHANSELRLVPRMVGPDYYPDKPGARLSGRMMDPMVYDGRKLGPLFARLRPPIPSFTIFGGMMVSKLDIEAMLRAPRSFKAFRHAAGLLLRHARDRLRYPRGTRLTIGNAVAGRLLQSLADKNVPMWNETTAVALFGDARGVVGALLDRNGQEVAVKARRGVVLATGGFPGRIGLIGDVPHQEVHHSMAPPSNVGDGIRLGLSAGGRLDDVNQEAAFWTPVSVMTEADGHVRKFAHLITDRQKPGLIAVDQAGRRFVNEALSYHDFVVGMHEAHRRSPAIPAHLICDARFIRHYGLGLVRPGPGSHRPFIRAGYLLKAPTLAGLAEKIGVPAETLEQTVATVNGYAATGVDLDFGRGGDAYQRYLGDPSHRPNPCLAPIARPPFYAVKVFPGDIGTSLGLRTDDTARVLDGEDRPIPGLFACGNDMNSVMAGTYPSGGITLGPAMTFGFIAAREMMTAERAVGETPVAAIGDS